MKTHYFFGHLIVVMTFLMQALAHYSMAQGLPKTKFVVGKPCPDFTLEQMQQYRSVQFQPVQARGKWLMLNFVSLGCTSSFSKLQRIDSLYRSDSALLAVVMVARIDPPSFQVPSIQEEYEQFEDRYRLTLPVGYSKTVFNDLDIRSAPYNVLVDPGGIVRHIFYINLVDQEQIREVIRGNRTSLVQRLDAGQLESEYTYNFFRPLLIDDNGGPDTAFVFRSLLTPEIEPGGPSPMAIQQTYGRRLQFINSRLRDLIYLAFGDTVARFPHVQPNSYGQYYPDVIWEGHLSPEDSVRLLQRLYCYSLEVDWDRPDALRMQAVMQKALEQYFNIEVRQEVREMPCYVLRQLPGAPTLRSKGGPMLNGRATMGRLTLKNIPMATLIHKLWGRYQQDTVFVDKTGIDYRIDITVDALLTDPISRVAQSLRKQGMLLELSREPMTVFVVRPLGASASRSCRP